VILKHAKVLLVIEFLPPPYQNRGRLAAVSFCITCAVFRQSWNCCHELYRTRKL